MEMESGGPSATKMKLAAPEIREGAPSATEAPGAEEEDREECLDRISHLPDAVLGDIVSLLPTKDGARTQTLASRWRHLWRAAPLNLDCRGLAAADEDVLPGIILSAHQGPGRRLCLPARHLQSRLAAMDTWLRSPALDSLQEIELYVPRYGSSLSVSQSLLPPPASVFRFSCTLRVATISQCDLPDNTVERLRFPQLRKLTLLQVKISEGSLHTIVARCPSLECLLLSGILGFRSLRINSPSLRSFGIRSRAGELIIEDTPSLERLLHLDLQTGVQVSVISAPKLETLGCISEWHKHSRFVFGSTVIQGLRVDSLTTVVRTVKILSVHMYYFNLDMVIDLLRCFPCLEKFYLKRCQSGETNLWRRKHQNLLRCLDIRLKTIVLGYYRGIRAQVNFATFFVLNARMLETMRFDVGSNNYNERFFAEQYRVLQMEKRASRGARLYFTKDCSHDVSDIEHVSDLDLTDPFECGCSKLGLVH